MTSLIASTRAHRAAWYAAAAVLLPLSNGRWVVPVVAWVAPIFMIRFLRSTSPVRGMMAGALLSMLAMRVAFHGLLPSDSAVAVTVEPFALLMGLFTFLPYVADRLIASRWRSFAATLVYPAACVSVEYLYSLQFGAWGSVASTQSGNLPLLQALSVTGIWGVTFLVSWFASVANWVLEERLDWSIIRRGVALYATTLAVALALGGLRLALGGPDAPTVRIASLTEDLTEMRLEIARTGYGSLAEMAGTPDRSGVRAIVAPLHDAVFARTRDAATLQPVLVMWPEAQGKVLEEDEPAFIARGQSLAGDTRIYLLMAYSLMPMSTPRVNKQTLVGPTGEVVWSYVKGHPIPGVNDARGELVVPFVDTPFGRLASVICYDIDFPGFIRQVGAASVDILVVPAWDWKAIDPMHAKLAVLRAIENGVSLVFHSGEGMSMAVDYQGRVLASMDHFAATDRLMLSHVPQAGSRTVYTYVGDAFAWLCLAGLGLLVVGSRRQERH
jgi:apolipoprotein N-acyltransferase